MSQADANLPYASVKICQACAADNPPQALYCWLCGASLASAPTVVLAEKMSSRRSISESLFAGLTILAVVVTLLVIVGLGLDSAGLAIALAVALGPPLAAIGVQSMIRHRRGESFSWQATFVTYFASIGVAILLAIALMAAAVVAMVIMCFQALASGKM
jgi:ribosomal protein L40E